MDIRLESKSCKGFFLGKFSTNKSPKNLDDYLLLPLNTQIAAPFSADPSVSNSYKKRSVKTKTITIKLDCK